MTLAHPQEIIRPGQMVVTFDDQVAKPHQDHHAVESSSSKQGGGGELVLVRMRSDTNVTLATEEDTTVEGSNVFGVPSSDEEDSSSSSCSSSTSSMNDDGTEREEEVKIVVRRRSSILKRYDVTSIPLKDKRSSWIQLPKPNLALIRSSSISTCPCPAVMVESDGTQHNANNLKTAGVRFSLVHMRAYDQTIGDNPSVSYGTPISLDWDYEPMEPVDLEVYEATRAPRRTMRQMMLNYYNRRNILTWRFGYTEEELEQAEKEANKVKRARSLTKALLPAQKLEEVVQSAARKTRRKFGGGRRPSAAA